MKIVSSAKLKTRIKERLISNYPDFEFSFRKDINEAIGDLVEADVFITYGEDLTDEIIVQAKNLKWIMVISAGLDQMPFTTIKEKGILVTNAKGIHKIPMAEYAISMMLQVARQSKKLIKNEQDHIWDRTIPMTELNGKTVGVLGAGAIGTQIAKYAQVFNMKTIGLNRSGTKVESFDEMVTMSTINDLLQQSDFVVSVLPSTPETDGIINSEIFKQMKETSVFINIGRGKSVIEKDLILALEEGEIAHAVLDVFENEPLPSDHPFWDMEKVTITPHLSGISAQYQQRAMEIFEKNLGVFLADRHNYLNVIDLDKGY